MFRKHFILQNQLGLGIGFTGHVFFSHVGGLAVQCCSWDSLGNSLVNIS